MQLKRVYLLTVPKGRATWGGTGLPRRQRLGLCRVLAGRARQAGQAGQAGPKPWGRGCPEP